MSLTLDDLAATSGTAAQDLARKSKELAQKQVPVPIAHTTERRAQRQFISAWGPALKLCQRSCLYRTDSS